MSKGGRPAKYETPEEMEAKIQEYWDTLEGPPTMAGIAGFLGFASRFSMNDYEKREEFSHLIKGVRNKIESFWEARLATAAATGAIFWLKNHGKYSDKTEIEHSGKDGSPIGFKFVSAPTDTGDI